MKRRSVDVIRVFASPGDKRRGRLRVGSVEFPCALGRSGPVRRKREGDGGTPVGRMRVVAAYFRADRVARPGTGVRLSRIGPGDGWCDDPGSPSYNRPIRCPAGTSHEAMWRDDGLYDVVLDLGWNRGPIRRGRGSAIFLHVARPGFLPTEGCVAVAPGAVARVLGRIGPCTIVHVVG